MRIEITNGITLVDGEAGTVFVTRPNMRGKYVTHPITSEYAIQDIAKWLTARFARTANPMVQNAFPNMSVGDREFLMTGITPTEWAAMFPPEEDEE